MVLHFIGILLASVILVTLLMRHVWGLFHAGSWPSDKPVVFFALIFLSMFALRLPIISLPVEINVDESQMLAQSMRFQFHPLPWRDVDGTTSGPLNSMVLDVPMWFGAPATWQMARTVHLVLVCFTILFLYLTLRCFGKRTEAQLALVPTIYFYTFALYTDFCHYSSETFSVLLLSASFFLLFREWAAPSSSVLRLFLLGLLLGTAPFAKLQAIPMVLLLSVAALVLVVRRARGRSDSQNRPWLKLAAHLLGLNTVPCLILAVLLYNHILADFWRCYIAANAAYVQEKPLLTRFVTASSLLSAPSDLRVHVLGAGAALAMLLALILTKRAKPEGTLLPTMLTTLLYSFAAIVSVLAAAECFTHHFLFLVPALAILLGLTLSAVRTAQAVAAQNGESRWFSLSGQWLSAAFIALCAVQLYKLPGYVQRVSKYVLHPKPAQLSIVSQCVRKVSRPGDTMSVWGWMPSYHIESGLAPATRDAISQRMISPGPWQAYFRDGYLKDMERNKPAVFVDAITQGEFTWGWWASDKHESFPELGRFIADNYRLWLTIHGTAPFPARIYLRNERMEALGLSPEAMTLTGSQAE